MTYASWGPIFWPFLRSSAREPKIKAVRGSVAIKGIFDACSGEFFKKLLIRAKPRGPNDQKNLIPIEIFDLDRNF